MTSVVTLFLIHKTPKIFFKMADKETPRLVKGSKSQKGSRRRAATESTLITVDEADAQAQLQSESAMSAIGPLDDEFSRLSVEARDKKIGRKGYR